MNNYIKKFVNCIGLYTQKDVLDAYENGCEDMNEATSDRIKDDISRIKELNGELERQKESIDGLMHEVSVFKEEAAEAIHNEQKALMDLELARADIKKLNKRIELLRKDNTELASEINKQVSDIADFTAEADKLRSELSDTAPKLEEYKRTVTEMGDEIEELKSQLGFVTADRDGLQDAYAKLSSKQDDAKTKKASSKKPAKQEQQK